MVIKEGYNGKRTSIRINVDGAIRLWLEQDGLPNMAVGKAVTARNGRVVKVIDEEVIGHSETLAYMDIKELIALRDECNEALRKVIGV